MNNPSIYCSTGERDGETGGNDDPGYAKTLPGLDNSVVAGQWVEPGGTVPRWPSRDATRFSQSDTKMGARA